MRHLRVSLWLGAAVAAFASTTSPCAADTVTLKNGREIHGRLVEEKTDSIRIRTSGGTITISKAEVATFSENASWEEYEKPRSLSQIEADRKAAEERKKAEEKAKDGGETPKPGKKPAKKPKDATGEGSREDAWQWGAELTEAQIDACTPIRDALWKELDELGPTAEERLAKYQLSSEEQADVKSITFRMGLNRRTGSAVQLRKIALKELIDGYGLKAAERVVKLLESNNLWQQRGAAEGIPMLMKLGEQDEAKWLLYHYKAPQHLVRLLEHQGDMQSPFIRELGAKALAAISGEKFGWSMPAKPDPMRSTAETNDFKKWRDWWKRYEPWWDQREKEKAERRVAIAADLEKLKAGTAPDGSTPGAQPGEDEKGT